MTRTCSQMHCNTILISFMLWYFIFWASFWMHLWYVSFDFQVVLKLHKHSAIRKDMWTIIYKGKGNILLFIVKYSHELWCNIENNHELPLYPQKITWILFNTVLSYHFYYNKVVLDKIKVSALFANKNNNIVALKINLILL